MTLISMERGDTSQVWKKTLHNYAERHFISMEERIFTQAKQSLVENISLQRCNCNIFGLADTVALFAKEARFFFQI